MPGPAGWRVTGVIKQFGDGILAKASRKDRRAVGVSFVGGIIDSRPRALPDIASNLYCSHIIHARSAATDAAGAIGRATVQFNEVVRMSLQSKLDAFKADFEAGKPPYNVPRTVIETMHRATAELIASGTAGRAKRVGDYAPAFSLKDAEDKVVSSVELLKRGPLVVSFYRGVWCPYCNMELQALEAARPEIEKLGATLLAISPQTQANSRKSVRQNKLGFAILSDPRGEVSAAFGLRFELPDYLVDLYKSLKNDLPTSNDDPSWTLPMPARYVIATDGRISYANVNPDYTRRPEPEELMPALKAEATRSAA